MSISLFLCMSACSSDEAFDTLRTRPEFAVFIFDAEANVLCEGRPLAEIVRYSTGRLMSVNRHRNNYSINHDDKTFDF